MSSSWNVNRNLALLIIIHLLAWPAWAHVPIPPKRGEPPRRVVHRPVPDFALVDQDGNLFRFSDTRGKLVLATFVFTTCPDVCPFLTAKFAAIQRALPENKRDRYRLLSITTDPQQDSPGALKAYGANFDADFRSWLFLTGNEQQLAAVWKAFGVHVTKSRGGQVRHTALTTLIDANGVRRLDYYTDRWQEKEILRDISWLEAQNGR